jgi:hypothetical protein
MKIKKGDKFICIKTVKMEDDGQKAYRKGFLYSSELDSNITDDQHDVNHSWRVGGEAKIFFLKIKSRK